MAIFFPKFRAPFWGYEAPFSLCFWFFLLPLFLFLFLSFSKIFSKRSLSLSLRLFPFSSSCSISGIKERRELWVNASWGLVNVKASASCVDLNWGLVKNQFYKSSSSWNQTRDVSNKIVFLSVQCAFEPSYHFPKHALILLGTMFTFVLQLHVQFYVTMSIILLYNRINLQGLQFFKRLSFLSLNHF